VCALLLITIGPIPLFHTFFKAITCDPNDALDNDLHCYTGIHLINTIFAVYALVLATIFTFISQLFFIDFNPASEIPFAGSQSIIGFYKLAMKIGLPLYVTLDSDLSSAKTFIIIYAVLWVFTLILRYRSRGYYDESVNIMAIATESIVAWAAVTSVFHAYIDVDQVDDIGLYFFLFASPFVAYTYYILVMRQKWGEMRINVRKMKKVSKIERFINIACSLIENKEEPQKRIELEGLLRYHTRVCRKDSSDCLCSTLGQNIATSLDPTGEEKKIWYKFVDSLIADSITKFPKNSRLRLQNAYFQQDRAQNHFKALFELMRAEENRPNIQEEFSIFRHKNIIEKEMMETDIRNSNLRGADVNIIVHFQEKFVVFQNEIGKSVNMQLNFWRELEQATPNVQQLLLLGSKITVQAETVKDSYSQLCAINPNHIRTLKIYGNFLKDIMNDNFEAQRIIEKAEYAEKSINLDRNLFETDRLKYSENSKTCILMCSGNIHSMGKVLDASSEMTNILNFSHSEIIGQSINQIMPEIIGMNHDALMMRYFQTSVPNVIGRERPVFPMNKAGYIVPCALMIKVYPNLDQGIRVVGFLRKLELNSSQTLKPKVGEEVIINSLRTHYIMYGGEHDEIYAVSESCYDSFGIPAQITNGNCADFTIDSIIPEFHEYYDSQLKTASGQLLHIDTTSLPESFLIGVNSENSRQDIKNENLNEKQTQDKYRLAQVRVTMIEDSNFIGNLKIRVLKLVEVGEENRKQASSEVNNNDETQINNPATLEYELDEHDDEHRESIEDARSEASNFSLSVGEDMRQLKDMKAKISEKHTPASISFLQTTSFIVCALLISIVSIQFDEKHSIYDELRFGFTATETSGQRHMHMSDINHYSRILYGSEAGYLDSIDPSFIRPFLEQIISQFNLVQFEICQARMIQNQTTKNFKIIRTEALSLQTDGTVVSTDINANQAYSIYAASAKRYIDIPISEFHSPDGYTSAEIAFYYIKANGLTKLRTASESVTIAYKDYYIDRTHSFFNFFLATMLIGIFFLFAAIFIMLPKIFSVNKTNMKVLSLFGYILPDEVQKLADKCESYMEEYLDEAAFHKEYSSYFSNLDESEERVQLTKNPEEEEAEEGSEVPQVKRNLMSIEEFQNESMTSANQDFTLQMREFSKIEDQIKLPVLTARTAALQNSPGRFPSTNRTTARDDKPLINIKDASFASHSRQRMSIMPPNFKILQDKIEKQEIEENEELQEYLLERSRKLKNSKDHSKKGVSIRMLMFASIFVAYFLGDFIHELVVLKNYRRLISHLVLLSSRTSDLKFAFLFAQEEIFENNITATYPSYPAATVATKNTRIEYQDKVLQNQVAIKESYQESFPYDFGDYFDTLLAIDNGDMCDIFYKNDKTSTAYASCIAAGDGKLKLGMVQTETSIVGMIEKTVKNFYNTPNRNKQTQIDIFESSEASFIIGMVSEMRPIQDYLRSIFVKANDGYLDTVEMVEQIKIIVFLVVLLVLVIFVLLPYLERLKQQIFRTKALLNMIPMSMIKKNKTLQEMFVSKEIFKALK